jgi:plastocyanin
MKRPLLLFVPCLALASLVFACSGAGEADIDALATEAANIEPQAAVSLTAEDLEYDTDTIVVPADSPVVITFENQDSGALHNVAVYRGTDATDDIFKGELVSGVETVQYEFNSPPAGVYYFKCDAHPDMNGVFIAK